MNPTTLRWTTVALALALLPACGLLKPDIGFGTGSASGSGSYRWLKPAADDGSDVAPWADARDHALAVADRIAADAPEGVALHDAATWSEGDAVLHDDVETLLDELWRRGLPYEIASEVEAAALELEGAVVRIRHVVLVREASGVVVRQTGAGHYGEGGDGWAAAELETPIGMVTLVATGLGGEASAPAADELLDALALAAGDVTIGCALGLEDDATGRLLDAGFRIEVAAPDRGLLLTRPAADR